MSKAQLEVLLSLITYICLGVGYTLHDDLSPSDFLEEMREESPEVSDVEQFAPKWVQAVTAFVWTVFMLMWPWYLAKDIGHWVIDNTFGRLPKKKKEDQENGEDHTRE